MMVDAETWRADGKVPALVGIRMQRSPMSQPEDSQAERENPFFPSL